ncbi:NAD-dependent epimerase/dehydratase family protein [Roseateles toxinivorans]|uniref:Putative dehydrogenase n=1 Tax=Roseateles toxinivorans TaxID=270368 RepID=A0A4R6QSU0_9BURK|nr:NAD-dependent epimerase/dehydratase family protein [Roseateles toxinivorans]TDP74614.1 putative dehydrogenase [Roseateles toxinivorans]
MPAKKITLIGAGNIARTHASVLQSIPGVSLHGVFDVSQGAAEAMASQFKIPVVHDSLEAAAMSASDVFHVLTPPNLHLMSAMPFVEAGKTVLIEKPVGATAAECQAFAAAAQRSGAVIGVNQNLAFNPAYLKLRNMVLSGNIGQPKYMSYIFEAPLRQLSARQFSHWMFREPGNILLEQAVHPLSQIVDLAGPVQELNALAERPIEISPGVGLHNACQVSMICERMPVSLRFHVGANFTVCRMTVVCDDGVAIADMTSNQFHVLERSAYMEPIDNYISSRKAARQWAGEGFAGLRDYALSMIKLKPRSDAFYLGMKGSIEAFYADLASTGKPRIDLAFGSHLVDVCAKIAQGFKSLPQTDAPAVAASPPSGALVAVLGGTGFIGAYTVEALLRLGYRVRVMARGAANLQEVFYRAGVEIVRGDVKSPSDVKAAVAGVAFAINLAHGGGGGNFEAIRAAMVDTASLVADACVAAGVKRLVHVGSISGLYLGDAAAKVTGSTPTDPMPHTRNDYAHAKALADATVLSRHQSGGMEVVVLRPGLVIGAGTSPFHGGLGFFNNDQYCVGWNAGSNPLPWVLVDDCATAIVAALEARDAAGKAYNLVGDVRPDARSYVAALARSLGRPLKFVPSSPTGLWLIELGKWFIKRVAGQKVNRPFLRDILSRGLRSQFDCSDAKRDLHWSPVADPAEFQRRAIAVHGKR